MSGERRDAELEALLRSALSTEADSVQPAGDGLSKIRARVAARPSWRRRWAAPALALAGAAAVIAGIAVLPRVLPDSDRGGIQAATRSPVPFPTMLPTASPTPPPTPSPTASPTATRTAGSPPAGTTPAGTTPAVTPSASPTALGDLPTVWPYSSRWQGAAEADADIAAGTYPNLRDPALTAVDFVATFAGRDGLTARRLGPYQQGLRMVVSRDVIPVSTVFLVRVRTGDDSPYVVVRADRAGLDPQDRLSLDTLPAVPGTAAVTVGGTVRRDPGEDAPAVTVQLREPGQDEPLARATAPVTLTGGVGAWSARLTPLRALTSTGVVAAWTTDADGGVLEFVAAPTGS